MTLPYILSVQLVVDVLIVRVFSQYDQNNPLVLAHAIFSLTLPSSRAMLLSPTTFFSEKIDPRLMKGRGEDDGAEDPAASGAQHQLRASSGGAASPSRARQ